MSLAAAASLSDSPAPPESQVVAFDDVAIAFGRNQVLDGVSFHLPRGETKVLLGVAGSGKSTILKLSLGLLPPDRGRIWVLGHDVAAMREEELFGLRSRVGMVFQESALFDSLTVRENVAYRLLEDRALSGDEIEQRVREVLRFVELEETLDKFPSELSGGMRRRVAIARAIATQPEVLLYDSPTAGLDPITSTTILELILKQRDVSRTSALLVTHRLQDAYLLATHCYDPRRNRVVPVSAEATTEVKTSFVVLRDGRVLFDGDAQELAGSRDPYIREYIA